MCGHLFRAKQSPRGLSRTCKQTAKHPNCRCRCRLVCVTWILWIFAADADATADAAAAARCAHSLTDKDHQPQTNWGVASTFQK